MVKKLKWSMVSLGFPGSSAGKDSACNAGDPCLIAGLERSPGEGHGSPLQYSCLEKPMDRGAWRAAFCGISELDATEWLSTAQHTVSSRMWDYIRELHSSNYSIILKNEFLFWLSLWDYSIYWQLEAVVFPIEFKLWLFIPDDSDSNMTYLYYCCLFFSTQPKQYKSWFNIFLYI